MAFLSAGGVDPFLGRSFPPGPHRFPQWEAEVLDVTTSEGEFHGDLLPVDVWRQWYARPDNGTPAVQRRSSNESCEESNRIQLPQLLRVFLAMLMA